MEKVEGSRTTSGLEHFSSLDFLLPPSSIRRSGVSSQSSPDLPVSLLGPDVFYVALFVSKSLSPVTRET